MIKGIIFDMDGTIVDSIPYHYEAWKKFLNEKKVNDFSKKLDSFKDKGGSTLDFMRSIYGNLYSKKELKKIIEEKEIVFRTICKSKIKPISGFIEFLNFIKSKNILVGLASNAIRKNVSMILNELEIYDHFDSIICGDEVINGKPNPEMFNESIDRFNINKNDCLIFEDSIEGVEGAINSGIKAIGVTSSYSNKILMDAGATETIENYININNKLKKIGLEF
jgi:HAD superfamily hydrolase (TIGR01509 family)